MGTISVKPRIVSGTKKDVPLIRALILELAEYERALPGEAPVTEKDLEKTLFGKEPAAEVLIAYLGKEPAGFALFFHNYSTWLGKRGTGPCSPGTSLRYHSTNGSAQNTWTIGRHSGSLATHSHM
jgi:hypothetical protein